MDEMKLYDTTVVPFTVYKEVVRNGQIHHDPVENITTEESRKLTNRGLEPVMLWQEDGTDYYYLAELPLVANRGTGIKGYLCYLYNDFTDEEKELFKNRTAEIKLTREKVTQVYSKGKVRK